MDGLTPPPPWLAKPSQVDDDDDKRSGTRHLTQAQALTAARTWFVILESAVGGMTMPCGCRPGFNSFCKPNCLVWTVRTIPGLFHQLPTQSLATCMPVQAPQVPLVSSCCECTRPESRTIPPAPRRALSIDQQAWSCAVASFHLCFVAPGPLPSANMLVWRQEIPHWRC